MIIKDYELEGQLNNDNSGYSKWGFVRKDGTEYFIKEFLNPVYPQDAGVFSETQMAAKIRICDAFEARKLSIYEKIDTVSRGSLVRIKEFFRFKGKYYIVNEKVEADNTTIHDIAALPFEEKLILCRAVAYGFADLHSAGVVHGDIKPGNILVRKTISGKYAAKIIDFDCSFEESAPPSDAEELNCDLLYMSPEAFLFINSEDTRLTCAMDTFSAALLFHQYLTGKLPYYDTGEYDYPFEAVLDGSELKPDGSLPEHIRELLSKMLASDASDRPADKEIIASLVTERIVQRKSGSVYLKKAGDLI